MLRIITLLIALSLIFTVAFPAVDAHIDTPLARHHAPAVLHRMIKKRSPQGGEDNNIPAGAGKNAAVANAGADPTPSTSDKAASSAAPQTNSQASAAASKTAATNSAQAPTNTASTSSGGLLSPILTDLLGGSSSSSSSSTSTTSSSTSTSSSSSTSASSTSTSSSLSTSSTPTSTASASPTAAPDDSSVTSIPSKAPVTITSSASAAASSAPATSSGSVTKLQRNTIIILIVIGASIGAAGLIWTIIRKWKFRPSSSFEDRMQPIDWQPTTGGHDEHAIEEKLHRNTSSGSNRSFTSGNNHNDHLTADLPPHDFTPGPAHLAPVGGYADLQRGPSPQPDLQRGPSFRSPSPYEYEVPNPAHGAYYNNGPDYNNGPYQAAAGYQGGYDHNRAY